MLFGHGIHFRSVRCICILPYINSSATGSGHISGSDVGAALYPLEMRRHADPTKKDVGAFSLLDKIPGVRRGSGGVVCLYDRLVTLSGSDKVIPVSYL